MNTDLSIEPNIRQPLAQQAELPSQDLQPVWFKTATGKKITSCSVPAGLCLEATTVLGGICSLFPGDTRAIDKKEVRFRDECEFRDWIYGWYPRMDQVHDAVGMPPKAVGRVVYVCEDTFFARRVAKSTGLKEDVLADIFRQAHEEKGAPAIERWIRSCGYKGPVEVVYTSDLEGQLRTALSSWEDTLPEGFKEDRLDRAKINLMYTGFWLNVLNIRGQAVVYEPEDHGLEFGEFSQLEGWMYLNPYGQPGKNARLGMIGYERFSNAAGSTKRLPCSEVINAGNRDAFQLGAEDAQSYSRNFMPGASLTEKILQAPNDELCEELERRIKMDVAKIYGGENDC